MGFTGSYSPRALSVYLLVGLLACDEDYQGLADSQPDSEQTAEHLPVDARKHEVLQAELAPIDLDLPNGQWEYVGQVAQATPTPEEIEEAAEIAASEDEQLFEGGYEAMLVFADGTAYGRVGAATDVPEVTPEQSVGLPDDYDPEAMAKELSEAEWILDHAEELLAHAPPEDTGTIFELSAESPGPVPVILGADTRTPVTSNSTLTSYPWRTVGNVLYGSTDSDNGACTATKIGPRHAITAAHCLHDCAGTWSSPIWFSPGQEGNSTHNGGPRKMVARYARTCSLSSDYGLLILADSSSFASLGWVGYGWWNDLDDYQGKLAYVRGYPKYYQTCTYSPRSDGDCGGYMYSQTRTLPSVSHTSGYLYHRSDTSGGQSGNSLIYFLSGGSPITLGVHKRGNEPGSGATITASPVTYNIAPRMRSSMWNDICTWIGAWPSSYASHPCQ